MYPVQPVSEIYIYLVKRSIVHMYLTAVFVSRRICLKIVKCQPFLLLLLVSFSLVVLVLPVNSIMLHSTYTLIPSEHILIPFPSDWLTDC